MLGGGSCFGCTITSAIASAVNVSTGVDCGPLLNFTHFIIEIRRGRKASVHTSKNNRCDSSRSIKCSDIRLATCSALSDMDKSLNLDIVTSIVGYAANGVVSITEVIYLFK